VSEKIPSYHKYIDYQLLERYFKNQKARLEIADESTNSFKPLAWFWLTRSIEATKTKANSTKQLVHKNLKT